MEISMPFESIATGIAPSTAPVSDANRAGNHVWLVAIAEDPATGEIIQGDIEAQTRQTLRNLDQAMHATGGTLADIVEVRVFLVDRNDAKGMNAVYAEFFSAPYPVRATVVVKELLADGLRIEITATAVLASAR
jgi:enamine deaminase RidA (YjgF/YER057c/UK114 family)